MKDTRRTRKARMPHNSENGSTYASGPSPEVIAKTFRLPLQPQCTTLGALRRKAANVFARPNPPWLLGLVYGDVSASVQRTTLSLVMLYGRRAFIRGANPYLALAPRLACPCTKRRGPRREKTRGVLAKRFAPLGSHFFVALEWECTRGQYDARRELVSEIMDAFYNASTYLITEPHIADTFIGLFCIL